MDKLVSGKGKALSLVTSTLRIVTIMSLSILDLSTDLTFIFAKNLS